MGEVAKVQSGWGFPKSEQGDPNGTLPFFKVSDMNAIENQVEMQSASNYITITVASSLKIKPAPPNTVIFPKIGAAIATNKKRILTQASAYDNNVMGIIPGPRLSPRFLLHWMNTFNLSHLASDSGAVPSIRKSDVERLLIPIPTMELQANIAAALDHFDTLVNDISVGLPAELAARRQQYEYYRDKLLTFKELPA